MRGTILDCASGIAKAHHNNTRKAGGKNCIVAVNRLYCIVPVDASTQGSDRASGIAKLHHNKVKKAGGKNSLADVDASTQGLDHASGLVKADQKNAKKAGGKNSLAVVDASTQGSDCASGIAKPHHNKEKKAGGKNSLADVDSSTQGLDGASILAKAGQKNAKKAGGKTSLVVIDASTQGSDCASSLAKADQKNVKKAGGNNSVAVVDASTQGSDCASGLAKADQKNATKAGGNNSLAVVDASTQRLSCASGIAEADQKNAKKAGGKNSVAVVDASTQGLNRIVVTFPQRFESTDPFHFLYSTFPESELNLCNAFHRVINKMDGTSAVITLCGQQLYKRDFETMQVSEWLNDKILYNCVHSLRTSNRTMCLQDPERKPFLIFEPMEVERYIKMFDQEYRNVIHVLFPYRRFHSRFEACMEHMNSRAQRLGELCKKNVKTICDCKGVVFLQNINKDHWILHYYNNKYSEVTQCDPLMSSRNSFTRFNSFIVHMIHYTKTGNVMLNGTGSCQPKMTRNLPQQNNEHDCGFFTILFLECIIRKVRLQFNPLLMKNVCGKLLLSILHKNTMLFPSKEGWGFSMRIAQEVIKK